MVLGYVALVCTAVPYDVYLTPGLFERALKAFVILVDDSGL